MKIKKSYINESVNTESNKLLEDTAEVENSVEDIDVEDIVVDDVLSASVSEIADAVQAAKEEESDGKETYTDETATKLATEIKTAAKGLDHAKWVPLDVPNVLTDILDESLSAAMIAQKSGRRDGVDVLINGLPGSGKTGIVKEWAKARGVNLFELDSNDDELGAVLKGFPVDSVRKGEDGNDEHTVIKSFSSVLDSLKDPMSVLFLDEFNRAPQSLRANLLKLINSHEVPGNGKNGRRRFDNLLFTIACINPVVDSDQGVVPLNDAEKSRFARKRKWDSGVDTALKYLNFYISKTIDNLDPTDDNYAFLYVRHKKTYNIAMALLTDPRFEFDSRADLDALDDDEMSMLNQRSITDGLMFAGHSKARFLRWVDEDSGFLQKNKDMIHEILDPWVEPDVQVPNGTANNSAAAVANDSNSPDSTSKQSSDTLDDFDSKFGAGGDELDTDLFGSTASNSGKAAKVNAADALRRIQSFDFSL